MCNVRATYAFNTWMKWKSPAKAIFLIHVVHDNLKKDPRFLIPFFQREGGTVAQWLAHSIELSRFEPWG